MPETFGEKLRRLLKQQRLSQQELADALDIPRNTVWRWVNDKTTPESNKLQSLATLLHVSVDDLLNNSAPDSGGWVLQINYTMYETYSAFKSYGDFYSFVNRLHININNSRADVGKAEREYQECVKNEGYSIHKSSILLDTLWRERFVLQALEEIETVLFSSLSEDAKNEMDRICKETDYHLESVRKAG